MLKGPTQKPSMNFRGTPQEMGNKSSPNLAGPSLGMGNKSSPNLASPPFEIGNRSPPPLDKYSGGGLSPPRQSSPYSDGTAASISRLNVINGSVGRTQSPPLNSGLDFQGLHTQTPPLVSPGYPNGSNDKYPTMATQDAQNGYGNASPPAAPRNYLAGFRELP